MEDKFLTEATMPYSKMKKYLSEWYYEPQFSLSMQPTGYDSSKVFHVLKEDYTGDTVFVWQTEMAELFNEDTMVSTSGIVGDELRGLIEQCYALDQQLEESAKEAETRNAQPSQKGE